MTQPGIPNEFALSTSCYGNRLRSIEDQAFAAVAMGFRRIELGLSEAPVPLNGFEDTRRETGIEVGSLVCGCLDPCLEKDSGSKLGSLNADQRERALISSRRHIRLARQYGCPVVILRGCEIENEAVVEEGRVLASRLKREDPAEMAHEVEAYVERARESSQRQVEHFCRSVHQLISEFPETRLVVEPGSRLHDLMSFETMGWVLDDLSCNGLGYWHDTGTVQLREQAGLPGQGRWLDAYAGRMLGVHLQDSAELTAEMPPGTGTVDFKLVAEYVPRQAEKVVEINPRHGRTEILAAVQYLIDLGF